MRNYRNIFAEMGYPQETIDRKTAGAWQAIFEGPERFYFDCSDGTGYITDTGNNDVRTEGMSYGMMMAVQYGRQDIFDRLWKWSMKNMFLTEGKFKGYFAWSCQTGGEKNAFGPAPDGEEYFAMALFFASARWGDGEGIFNYSAEARSLLSACLHQGDDAGAPDRAMWDHNSRLIRFVPCCGFSDPSYHLPHFYELFAERSEERDRGFWKKAAAASREYIVRSCHPQTGLAPEYAEFDGTPNAKGPPAGHGDFYSDAYRVALNTGLDALWNGVNKDLSAAMGRLVSFFAGQDSAGYRKYSIDGTPHEEPALHPVGLIAANAAAAPALIGADGIDGDCQAAAEKAVRLFWETPPRSGVRRYYDNCLYFFALLVLSGQYRIW